MEETSKTYDAFLIRQRKDAPLQVAFVAPSAEIDEWARVPTKKTGNVRNFQRAEIASHIAEVQKFFENNDNASPTAVVVGFDPIRSKGRVIARHQNGDEVETASVPAGSVVPGKIDIRWVPDDDPQGRSEIVAAIERRRPVLRESVLHELQDISGLTREALEKVDEALQANVPTEADADRGEEDEQEAEDSDSDEADSLLGGDEDALIPSGVAEMLPGLSPSEAQVVVGRLSFLSRLSEDHLKDESEESLLAIYREVNDELKPGLIIDGQHRVMGTKKLGTIPFLVTALPSADWPELAFQFIVTNRTARRVPESLLISIVGNSLSKAQRGEIEERLRQANIRVGLIEAVMKVHEDETSPFYGALAFGLKGEKGFLDAAAMRGKVVQLWYERKPPVRELFDHMCEGKLVAQRTEHWKSEEIWFDTFIAFWSAVQKRYQSSGVFSFELSDHAKKTPASKLMTSTVLKIFQETVLENIRDYVVNAQKKEGTPISASITNTDSFSKLVTNTLTDLNPEFFEGWQLSGFDGSKGARDDLSEAIRLVIEGDKTVSQLKNKKNPHRLFKE